MVRNGMTLRDMTDKDLNMCPVGSRLQHPSGGNVDVIKNDWGLWSDGEDYFDLDPKGVRGACNGLRTLLLPASVSAGHDKGHRIRIRIEREYEIRLCPLIVRVLRQMEEDRQYYALNVLLADIAGQVPGTLVDANFIELGARDP